MPDSTPPDDASPMTLPRDRRRRDREVHICNLIDTASASLFIHALIEVCYFKAHGAAHARRENESDAWHSLAEALTVAEDVARRMESFPLPPAGPPGSVT